MIKINVLRSMQDQRAFDAVMRAAREFEEGRAVKSFADRHPELGKMINCGPCGTRHRSSKVCFQVFRGHATDTVAAEDGSLVPRPLVAPNTRNGVNGARNYRGRILRHRNRWGLMVLDRANQYYREEIVYFPTLQVKAENAEVEKENEVSRDKIGKSCLYRALTELRASRAARRRKLFKITRESRRINRASR